jgi:hypothetical protein
MLVFLHTPGLTHLTGCQSVWLVNECPLLGELWCALWRMSHPSHYTGTDESHLTKAGCKLPQTKPHPEWSPDQQPRVPLCHRVYQTFQLLPIKEILQQLLQLMNSCRHTHQDDVVDMRRYNFGMFLLISEFSPSCNGTRLRLDPQVCNG